MVVEEENTNDSETEIQDRIKSHEVQLQILVEAIQVMKDRIQYILERRDKTPPREDRSGGDFQEDLEHEKKNKKKTHRK